MIESTYQTLDGLAWLIGLVSFRQDFTESIFTLLKVEVMMLQWCDISFTVRYFKIMGEQNLKNTQ